MRYVFNGLQRYRYESMQKFYLGCSTRVLPLEYPSCWQNTCASWWSKECVLHSLDHWVGDRPSVINIWASPETNSEVFCTLYKRTSPTLGSGPEYWGNIRYQFCRNLTKYLASYLRSKQSISKRFSECLIIVAWMRKKFTWLTVTHQWNSNL